MSSVQVLSIGSNPNLVFYGWRLQETKSVDVTLVNSTVDNSKPISFQSSSLGNLVFKPHHFFPKLAHISEGTKFDIVILSSTSLQDFQTLCTGIVPYLNDDSTVIVESTGYINLEPFVKLSLPNFKNLSICSIMNESDVRQVTSNEFIHTLRNNDNRIYLGTSLSSDISTSSTFQKSYKLFQLVQEDGSSFISLLKSTNPKEFMTYQWKLALPRVVFNPLSIIFESEFPENLSSQILCKPLIAGIINEIFKIIKKMDCKLVKGSENEANLMNNWSSCFPKVLKNTDYLNSPPLFYNFYKQYDLEIDLLLLQPILLADDHGIRTPYLENLYSIMCQLIKLNDKESKSIFFTRKNNNEKFNQLNQDYEYKLNQLNTITQDLSKKQFEKQQLDTYNKEKEIFRVQLDNDIIKSEIALKNLNLNIEQCQKQLEMRRTQNKQLEADHVQKLRDLQIQDQVEQPEQKQDEKPVNHSDRKYVRDSIQPGDNLEDLADIALYGDTLNGENPPISTTESQLPPQSVVDSSSNQTLQQPPQPTRSSMSIGSGNNVNGDLPQFLHEKEIEIQGREQALLNKELQVAQENQSNGYRYDSQSAQLCVDTQQLPPQKPYNYPYQYYQQIPPQGPSNGYNPSPIDQQPPHGLPSDGLPPNGLPPNLRSNRFQPNNFGPRQRLNSIPSSVHTYYDNQPQYGYHPSQYQPPSFQHAAPIDPLLEQRFRANPKKQNRKSAYPQMNGNSDGLGMGGRGGMPMLGLQAKNNKHRSMGPTQITSPTMQQKKSTSNSNISQQQSQQFLQPPMPSGSNASSNSSSNSMNTSETPKTNDSSNDSNGSIQINVPLSEAKPLGGISNSNKENRDEKKKKRGLFGKKK